MQAIQQLLTPMQAKMRAVLANAAIAGVLLLCMPRLACCEQRPSSSPPMSAGGSRTGRLHVHGGDALTGAQQGSRIIAATGDRGLELHAAGSSHLRRASAAVPPPSAVAAQALQAPPLVSLPSLPWQVYPPSLQPNYSAVNTTHTNCLSIQIAQGLTWPDDILGERGPPLPLSSFSQPNLGVTVFFAPFNPDTYTTILRSVFYFNTGLAMGKCTNMCWNMSKGISAVAGVREAPLESGSGTCLGPVVARSPFSWQRDAGTLASSPAIQPSLARYYCLPQTHAAFDFIGAARGGQHGFSLCTDPALLPFNGAAQYVILPPTDASNGTGGTGPGNASIGQPSSMPMPAGTPKPAVGQISNNTVSSVDKEAYVGLNATVRFLVGSVLLTNGTQGVLATAIYASAPPVGPDVPGSPGAGGGAPSGPGSGSGSGRQGEDLLVFNPPQDPSAPEEALPPDLTWRWDAATGTMSFSGVASLYAYETALSLVRYTNTGATSGTLAGAGPVTPGIRAWEVSVTLARAEAPLVPIGTAVLGGTSAAWMSVVQL